MDQLSQACELLVVRHGQTDWNLGGRHQGHRDSPLTALGVAQAKAAAERLARTPVNAVHSSDLERAMATARLIQERLGLSVVPEPGLREQNLGVMEGLTREQIQQQHPGIYERYRQDVEFVIPGGESTAQKHQRVVDAFERIARGNLGRRLVVVCHGFVLESLLRHAIGLDLHIQRQFALLNGSLNLFRLDDRGWRMISWGDVAHLEGLGTADHQP